MRRIVFSFNPPEFYGEIVAEIEPLRASDAVRAIDALAVRQLYTRGNRRRHGREVTKER